MYFATILLSGLRVKGDVQINIYSITPPKCMLCTLIPCLRASFEYLKVMFSWRNNKTMILGLLLNTLRVYFHGEIQKKTMIFSLTLVMLNKLRCYTHI